jgi:quercetin dioxygenase-like cupin family protein
MKVSSTQAIEERPVTMEGSSGCTVRWLVDANDGAPNFAMRQFEVQPGGYTPRHSHPYEHEVYVLAGAGEVYEGDQPRPLKAGDVVYVAPDEVHQFRNTGSSPMRFICMVPNTAGRGPASPTPECAAVELPK